MSLLWTKQEDMLLEQLVDKPIDYICSQFQKAKALKTEGFTNFRSAEGIGRKLRRLKEEHEDPMAEVDKRWQRLENLSKKHREEEELRYVPTGAKDRIILSLSDIHFPFTPIDRIRTILDKYVEEFKEKESCICLNGDIMEQYAASSFGKYKKVALIDEYNMTLDLIDLCLDYTDYVFMTRGNHEKRLNRNAREAIANDEVATVLGLDLLAKAANGEEIDRHGLVKNKREHFKDRVFYQLNEPWYIRIGKTIFAHPAAFKSGPGGTVTATAEYFASRYGREDFDSVVMGHCFDDQTEILTTSGWKTIDTIEKSDVALTVNKDTNVIEPNEIQAIHIYDNFNELIYFGSDNNFQMAVTPEHGMIYKTVYKKNLDWQYSTAKEIEYKADLIIPCAATEQTIPDLDITDDMLKFLAWTVTEGCFEKAKLTDGSTTFSIRIAQSDDPREGYISRIENILNSLEFKFSKVQRYEADTTKHGQHRNFDAYRFYISRKDSRRVLKYLGSDKIFKQDFLNKLSLRQRLILIEELCMGDGSKCSGLNFVHYYTKSEKLRDQVQFLLVTSGFKSNSKIRKDGTYYISFGSENTKMPFKSERRAYDGKVWCLTVANGTLIARRKGWTFITQNTHNIYKGVVSNRLLIEQGALCGRLGYEHQDNLAFKHSQNGYAVIYQDKDGNTNFNDSNVVYLGSMLPKKKKIIF